jgi:hypothetical protein
LATDELRRPSVEEEELYFETKIVKSRYPYNIFCLILPGSWLAPEINKKRADTQRRGGWPAGQYPNLVCGSFHQPADNGKKRKEKILNNYIPHTHTQLPPLAAAPFLAPIFFFSFTQQDRLTCHRSPKTIA